MEVRRKRTIFLAAIILLVAILVIGTVVILLRGPRDSVVELISSTDTEYVVDDLYEGKMTIPRFDIPANSYDPESFSERRGIVSYEGGTSRTGINVNMQKGEIDWEAVAAGGVDFAMIRVGFRMNETGIIVADTSFEDNMQGAIDAGIPVGVYFYSKAVTETEAEEEATFVLEQIRGYNVTYPVAFYWEYDLADDGSKDLNSRTVRCNGDQVTGFIDTFCKKVKASGRTAAFYCNKSMGYGSLDLAKLSGYDMWYAEFRSIPSFYYDFAMWQYTKEGNVPGIEKTVPVTLCFKNYG